MKKNFLLCMIFIASSFVACNDTPDEVKFPVTLYPDKIVLMSHVRTFINGTEIFDKESTDKFIEGTEFFNIPNNESDNLTNHSILFLSKDTIVFEHIKFSVKSNNKQSLFYSSYPILLDPDFTYISLLKHTDEIFPLPGGFSSTKEVRVAYGNYTDLDLSVLVYKESKSSHDGSFGSMTYNRVFNEFNEDYIIEMKKYPSYQMNDTLAIQEYRIKYKAK